MDFDYNYGNYREPEAWEEIDRAEELWRGDWYRAGSIWDGWNTRPYAAISDSDPIAALLREKVGIFHWGRSLDLEHYYDATPWVASAAEIFELLGEGKTEERLRAEGVPTTLEETDRRLRRVITALQAEPGPFWDPCFAEWCEENRVGGANSPHRYKEAYLHGEVWVNGDTLEELYALFALRPGDRLEPRKTIARVVYKHIRLRNRGPEPVVDDPNDGDYSF